jgi:hypothetical protein
LLLCGISLAKAADVPEISVVSMPAMSAVERQMKGDYAQHDAAARELLRFISTACKMNGLVFGQYPEDPGAVGMANVHWTLGYEMNDRSACASAISPPYVLVQLPADEAAVLNTSLSKTPQAGLAMFKWLPDSGYVQAGPTRIEYLEPSGKGDSAVRIVMPVKRRTWP